MVHVHILVIAIPSPYYIRDFRCNFPSLEEKKDKEWRRIVKALALIEAEIFDDHR